jgi:hypothetical protein
LARAEKLPILAQLAAVHYFTEIANLGSFFSTQEVEQITTMMENKQILEEIRDIYSARLKPLLVGQGKQAVEKNLIKKNISQLITS